MARHLCVAAFESEQDLIRAVREARERGYAIQDVLTPYAVHGLDKAMGLRPSRLSWACLAFAVVGASVAMWLQYWTSTIDWPLNVGGKPFNSLPAFVPVAFELAVLFAGLGTVACLFVRCGLFPGKTATLSELRATDDRFVLLLEQSDAAFDRTEALRLCRRHHAVWCGERIGGHLFEIEGGRDPDRGAADEVEPDLAVADAATQRVPGARRHHGRPRRPTGAIAE